MSLSIIKKAISEFSEYPRKVKELYGGHTLYWRIDMVWCLLKYGARPVDYYRFGFCKFNRFERNRYFTFYRYKKVLSQLKKSGVIFADKVREYKLYADFIKREWTVTKGIEPEDLQMFIKANGPCIAKPNGGEQGNGIFIVTEESLKTDPDVLKMLNSGDYVLEKRLSNCDEFNLINESSLNTLRVYTILDKKGTPHILNMMLRVGKTGAEVDNWGAGGVGYEINLENGVIHGYGVDKKGGTHIKHPGTDMIMPGFKIPKYDDIIQMIMNLCRVDSKARLVGWDIAVTPNGPELIEMNCPAGHDFLQAFGTPYYDKIKELW